MNLITFDIETWGLKDGYTLQPWRVKTKEAGILSIAKENSLGDSTGCVFPTTLDIKQVLNAEKGDILCGWNLKFDLAFLIALGMKPYLHKFRYLDGMLLLKKLGFNLQSYGLKQSLKYFKEHLNVLDDYDKDIKFKTGEPLEMYSLAQMKEMLEYNIKDASYTMQLIKYLMSLANKDIIMQAIRESTVSFLFADAWQNGILIDKEVLATRAEKMKSKCDKLEILLAKVDLTPKIIASPKQLQEYVQDHLKIKLTEKTEKGSYSVNSKALKNIYYNSVGRNQQILRLILKYKEFKTEQIKFINSALTCTKETDRIYPDPILSGTYTGRLTYSMYQNITKTKHFKNGKIREVNTKIQTGIPMHQIKKSGHIRDIFVAPENYSIVELDFSAQEMRLIACIANETTMIKLFNNNKDMHAYTAAGIAGMEYDVFMRLKQSNPDRYNELRKLGKLTNLALQYRLGVKGLYRQWHDVYGLTDKTMQDAMLARSTYLRLYPGIPRYWESNPTIAKYQKMVESKGFRRCSLEKWDLENEYKSAQTAINFPIQATGADQKILALYCLREYLYANAIQFAWDLHDGMFFYVPESMMQREIVLGMVEILNKLPYEKAWGWQPQVEFPVEAKIGKRWGELEVL